MKTQMDTKVITVSSILRTTKPARSPKVGEIIHMTSLANAELVLMFKSLA